MPATWLRPKRLLTLGLLALAVAVAVWWVLYIPYDPLAIYRPIPASATVVGRHTRLPERWLDILGNPLSRALMRTAGANPDDAGALVTDPESRQWFEKLAGREGTLAYLPGQYGHAPAWMAVSQLGGESQKLRWQLMLFKVPGFVRMKEFPGRSVWLVTNQEIDPTRRLVIAFGEGVLMACLSEESLAIADVLAAYDGRTTRLLDAEASFARFAREDDRAQADRFWLRDESGWAAREEPGITVDLPVLRADAMQISASTTGGDVIPEDQESTADIQALAARLGAGPCLMATVRRDVLLEVWSQADLSRDVRHALRMALDVATGDRLAVMAMDGELGGRLTFGIMRVLGAGVRVPTLMLATPVEDEAAAHAAIQRVLDASNARYRAAFVLKPVSVSATTIYVLESAGRNEWVDELPQADRPAYAVLDGWLLASSNFSALQKLANGAASEGEGPTWQAALTTSAAVSAWLDLRRVSRAAKGAIATWSMVQAAFGGDAASAAQLNEAKAWIEAFEPFGEARAGLGRRDGHTTFSLVLGLSE